MKNDYMKEAIELSWENAKNDFRDGGPFGAVVVDKIGNIIGKGKNSVICNHDATAHAEIMAIRDAGSNISSFDLSGCSIYTSCYPCPMCMAAILWSGIDKIYYANTKEDAEEIGFRDSIFYEMLKSNDFKDLKLEQMNREEAIKVFEEYKNNEKSVEY